jgi:hypothetical protein
MFKFWVSTESSLKLDNLGVELILYIFLREGLEVILKLTWKSFLVCWGWFRWVKLSFC